MSEQYCVTLLNEDINESGDNQYLQDVICGAIQLPIVLNKVELIGPENTLHKRLFKIDCSGDLGQLHQMMQLLSQQLSCDIMVKPWQQKSITPKLLIMDMDSTLVQAETIDEIARIAGIGEKVAEITESAMRGELDFTESLHARVAMLKGISIDSLEAVHDCLPLTQGALCLLKNAKANQCHCALVSGGFTLFASPIAKRLGFDTLSANQLEFVDDKLTGKVIGKIVDGKSKLNTLKELQQQLSITSAEIVAIGDGANDLLMLSAAGNGIAFHAKPKVQQQAKMIINYNSLEAVNWLLNW